MQPQQQEDPTNRMIRNITSQGDGPMSTRRCSSSCRAFCACRRGRGSGDQGRPDAALYRRRRRDRPAKRPRHRHVPEAQSRRAETLHVQAHQARREGCQRLHRQDGHPGAHHPGPRRYPARLDLLAQCDCDREPMVTAGKIPAIITNAATAHITNLSPLYVRVSGSMWHPAYSLGVAAAHNSMPRRR